MGKVAEAGASPATAERSDRPAHQATPPPPAQASEELFRLLVASVKDYAIFMLDPRGYIKSWNAGAERIKLYRADEIIGKHFSIFYPPESLERDYPAQELRIAASRGSFEDEGWRVRKDGSQFWANVVITALFDGHGVLRGFAKVTRDLTERRRVEQELLGARADLERRVEERTRELGETNAALRSEIRRRTALEGELRQVSDELRRRVDELYEADRHKNEYLAMLAHELRNPLAPIANGLQLLAATGGDPTDATTVEMMDRQMRILVRLVDDLLDLSRVMRERIELRRTTVALGEIVEAALETAKPVIEVHRQQIVTSIPREPVTVSGDPVRLAQVFANLLVNAAKYTDRPGRIELDAEYRDGWVSISVRDQGIGIDSSFLPHVFDLFSQADGSLDRARGGLGVGLTLSRRLVELHGGTITASSAGLGRGSVFVVRLPAQLGAARQQSARGGAASTETPTRRVLIVDDAVDAADSTAALARIWGHETRVLYDGAGVIDAVLQFRPDVVLLDIGLPGVSGYELARKIRALDGGGALELLALTGYGRDEDRRQAEAAGFDHHLVKPIDAERLREILAS